MGDSKLQDDLKAIRAIAEVLEETGLAEVEIERGQSRLRVSRTGSAPIHTAAAMPAAPAAPGAIADAGAVSTGTDMANHPGAVTSPMVGTAYIAPSPGAAPFVSVGATVNEGQTVMIVEAMKTMNEIKAPRGGKVTQILAQDSEPVEFGEVLMIVE